MTQDKIREAFEAWYRKAHHNNLFCENRWDGYQACAAEMGKDVEKMREALLSCDFDGNKCAMDVGAGSCFDERLIKEALALADKWRG